MRIHPFEAGTEVFTGQEAVDTLEAFDLPLIARSPVGTLYAGDEVAFLHVQNSRFQDVVYAARCSTSHGNLINDQALLDLARKLGAEGHVEVDPTRDTATLDHLYDLLRDVDEEWAGAFK